VRKWRHKGERRGKERIKCRGSRRRRRRTGVIKEL